MIQENIYWQQAETASFIQKHLTVVYFFIYTLELNLLSVSS